MKHILSILIALILGFVIGWLFTIHTITPEYYIDDGVYFVTDAFGFEWVYDDI